MDVSGQRKVAHHMNGILAWISCRIESLRSERGAAAVEYGLLVALIAVAILATVAALGSGVKGTFCSAVSGLGFGPCP
jgi:pilus assembly protein Flp/PilA